jgi:tetratricopeptide (TPR) repeat protein
MPEQISSYRLESELARGGMGIVYRGVHTVFEEVVAIKGIFPELTLNPELRARFVNEAKIQRRLQHPNIVQIREFLIIEGRFYIVMELIEGETLAQRLKRLGAPLLATEALEIFRQALHGLAFAHAQGVIHRDMKPSNVMLTREGVAKLTDFGIARAVGVAGLTRTGMVIGTPAYMAPEQVQGHQVDKRTDIYSLGVTLYEMVAGRVPFEKPKNSDSDYPVLRAHIEEPPLPPSRLVPSIPLFIEAAILKAMAKRPEERFASCEAFEAALVPPELSATKRVIPTPQAGVVSTPAAPTPEALEDLRAKGVPESVLKEVTTQIPRGQSPEFYLKEGDRLLGEGCHGEAITYYRKILEELPDDPAAQGRIARAEERQKAAEAEAQRREQEKKQRAQLPYYRQQLRYAVKSSDRAAVVQYGRKILSLEPRDREAEEAMSQCYQSYVLKQTLKGHHETVNSVAFSAHGRLLASGSDDKTIKLWDVASGAPKQTLTEHESSVYSVAFSPDGRVLASGSHDYTIKLWDVASGALKKTLSGHEAPVHSVAFSPDGHLLASTGHDKTIKLWDVASRALKQTLRGHRDFVFTVAFSPDGLVVASGSDDKTVKLWDVPSGEVKQALIGHTDVVWSVAFSPDGLVLASGSWDKTIKLWDVTSGPLKQTLSGHQAEVNSVAFSPDGRLLASGSEDKTIKLWERAP